MEELAPCNSSAVDVPKDDPPKEQPFLKNPRVISLMLEHLRYISDPVGKDWATITKYSFAEECFYLHLPAINFCAIASKALSFSLWKEAELHCQMIRK